MTSLLTRIVFLTGLFSISSPLCRAAQPQIVAEILKGKGEVVFLKDEFVSATTPSGYQPPIRTVFYHRDQRRLDTDTTIIFPPRGKLSCMVTYSTAERAPGVAFKLIPGKDVSLPAGTHAAWEIGETLPARYDAYVNRNGFLSQQIKLSFYSEKVISSLSCSCANPPASAHPLTVQDFEEAFQGLITLRPLR